MRTVLIATRKLAEMKILTEHYPAVLLPLVDRPFIQHVVEYLVNQGITDFDVILSHLPDKVETLFGYGKRWGVNFRYHIVKEPNRPYQPLKNLNLTNDNDHVLLIHADRLAHADIMPCKPASPADGPVLYCLHKDSSISENEQTNWTGWGWLSKKCLENLPEGADEDSLFEYLMSFVDHPGQIIEVPELLGTRTCGELISTQNSVLSKKYSGLMFAGKEVEKGIWLSRNVSLHPTVRLSPPVFIGENCRIGKGVQLGPNTVIGRDCVLDEKSTIMNSNVFPGSYIGEGLELSDVLVDRNCLVNVRVGSEVTITEDFILGSLTERRFQWYSKKIVSQFLASMFLLLTLPVFFSMILFLKLTRRSPIFHKRKVVRLPASSDTALWRTFSLVSFAQDTVPDSSNVQLRVGWRDLLLRFFPAMINVAKGELSFVGTTPRSRDMINKLPEDWRAIYLKSKPGIVTEALVNFGAEPTQDELYSAETLYTVSAGLKYDCKILVKYFAQIIGISPSPETVGSFPKKG